MIQILASCTLQVYEDPVVTKHIINTINVFVCFIVFNSNTWAVEICLALVLLKGVTYYRESLCTK